MFRRHCLHWPPEAGLSRQRTSFTSPPNVADPKHTTQTDHTPLNPRPSCSDALPSTPNVQVNSTRSHDFRPPITFGLLRQRITLKEDRTTNNARPVIIRRSTQQRSMAWPSTHDSPSSFIAFFKSVGYQQTFCLRESHVVTLVIYPT